MRKLSLGILALVATLTLMGCSAFQKSIIDITQQDQENAQTTRIVAREIGSTWELNSGFLTPALKVMKGLVPCDCESDIKALDDIAAKCVEKDANGIKTCNELSDKEMGETVWLWAKTWGTIVKSGANKIMETFFPAVIARIMPYITALGL